MSVRDGAAEPEPGGPWIKDRFRRAAQTRRIIGLVRPYLGRFVLGTLFLFVGSGIALVYPQAVRFALDEGMAGEASLETFDRIGLGLIALFCVQAVFTWLRHYLMSWLGERAVVDLRIRVTAHLLRLPPGWFHDRRTGELVGRIAGDVVILESFVGSELSMGLRNLVQMIGATTLLFVVNPDLALFMLAVVPAMVITVVVFGRFIRKLSRGLQDAIAETNARVQEAFGAIETVQAFGQEEGETQRYRDGALFVFARALGLARWRASFFAVATLSGYLALGVMVWIGMRRVAAGEITAGELMAFILYSSMAAVALTSLASLWGALQRAGGATERLFEILDTHPEVKSPAEPEPLPAEPAPLVLEKVRFAYSPEGDEVLKGIDLHIAPGETVALVGPSGAGKTTLTNLVLRFYDPTGGRIRLGEVDYRDADLGDLRSRMAVVPQDPVLFAESIAANLAYGAPDASEDAIRDAARRAFADEFIQGFPAGYETLCGERGVKLSGGQRQRIAIGRALLVDPQILILDEATSSLDAQSEAYVQKALAEAARGRTTLVIAHRLSTVRHADRIVVMERGRIVEQGTHEALMAADGLYRRLVHHQLEGAPPLGELGEEEPSLATAPGSARHSLP